MSQCKVYLENYSGTYYPGSEIRGRVECYFNEETTLRGIKIRLKCKEHNEWTGEESYRDPIDNKEKTRYITLTGDNNILYNEQMLYGSASGSHVLNRGRHVYPFSFFLPEDIPSTFNGPHGSIRYIMKAIVDRPMRFDYEDEFIFVVVSPIDFNKISKDLQETVSYSDEKTICCWCCQGGNITLDVELPKTGIVAGETVPFKVNVCNMSNSNVENLKVKFTKTIKYKVTSPHYETKDDVEEILSFKEHGVGAHGEHTFNLQLAVPQYIVVPNFARCSLFEVSYLLKVSCEMPSCILDLDVSIWDIKMGHIQKTDVTQQAFTNQHGFTANFPPMDGVYPPPLPPNTYAPPPAAPYPYPPSNTMGFAAPGAPPPNPFGASAPFDNNSKAQEAANTGPSAPAASAMPPPSYNEVQQAPGNYYPLK